MIARGLLRRQEGKLLPIENGELSEGPARQMR